MSPTRREALVELSALLAIPLVRWPERLADPLAGTIAEYQAGRARRDWSAAEVTKQALDRAQCIERLAPRDRRALADGAGRRARFRRPRAERDPSRTARRRSRVREGDLRHERPPDDGFERRVGEALSRRRRTRLARGRAHASGRRDRARQDRRRRLRVSRQRHELSHRPGAQSVRLAPARRRLADRAPARRSRWRAASRSPRSAPTTADRIGFRRSSAASSE